MTAKISDLLFDIKRERERAKSKQKRKTPPISARSRFSLPLFSAAPSVSSSPFFVFVCNQLQTERRKRSHLSVSISSPLPPLHFPMGMKRKGGGSLLLLLLLLLVSLVSLARSAGDADVMSDLAKSLTNVPPNWTPGTNFCQWTGVTCQGGSVTALNLPQKSLAGGLPASFNHLTSLQTLNLQRNQISGALPSFSGMGSLQILNLADNAFTSIPSDLFSGLTSLQELSLDDNPLSPWPLPAEDLAKCPSLRQFSTSNASVTGPLPDMFAHLSSLEYLRLSYNNLSGLLPDSLAGSAIKQLWLNNQISPQKLNGPIDVIGFMTELSLLWLQSNAFTGPIPDLSELSSLTSFNVRDNQLTGVVPKSLAAFASLQNVSIANNLLQGPMPSFAPTVTVDFGKGNNFCTSTPGTACDPRVTTLLSLAGGFGYPKSLANSWKENNPCNGPWAGVVCDTQGKEIIVLNLANQHLEGTISPDIANLTSLTKLLLSNNNITGHIPSTLTGLKSLQLLDLTNNDIYGKVPDFSKSVNVKIGGNPRIGTEPPPAPPRHPGMHGGPGSEDEDLPNGKSKSSSGGFIVGIVVAVLLLALCSVILIYYLRRRKNTKWFGPIRTDSPQQDLTGTVKIGITHMSAEAQNELFGQGSGVLNTVPIEDLRKATDNFSEANILGQGGFAVVYKGILNGTTVAVKRCHAETMSSKSGGDEEFDAEVSVLQKTRHRHLVTFLGFYRDNTEKLLVYEYMSNGTLGQHLFDREGDKYCLLNFKQRLVVALDVAKGIEYLHSLAQESFIHRDLKASNILLDDELRAKVSDFGLVKLVDKEKSMMTRLAGTVGYLAPEYALTGKVTTKVDVYAFGLILMELITGKKVLDESLAEEDTHLVMVFRKYITNKEKFMTFVDPSFNIDDKVCESIFQVAELACHCTAREPGQRPSMGYAVHVLSPLVDEWAPSSSIHGDDSSMSLAEQIEKWQSDDSFGPYSFQGNSNSNLI